MVRLPKIESLVDLAFKPLVVAVDALIVGHSIFLELLALTVTLASLELTNVLGAARKPEERALAMWKVVLPLTLVEISSSVPESN